MVVNEELVLSTKIDVLNGVYLIKCVINQAAADESTGFGRHFVNSELVVEEL